MCILSEGKQVDTEVKIPPPFWRLNDANLRTAIALGQSVFHLRDVSRPDMTTWAYFSFEKHSPQTAITPDASIYIRSAHLGQEESQLYPISVKNKNQHQNQAPLQHRRSKLAEAEWQWAFSIMPLMFQETMQMEKNAFDRIVRGAFWKRFPV